MDLLVLPDGTIRAIYAEEIELDSLGHAVITRASHVGRRTRPVARRSNAPLPARFSGRSACVAKPWRPSWPGS